MYNFIISLAIIFITTSTLQSQSMKSIPGVHNISLINSTETRPNILKKTSVNNNRFSINTSFVYMFLGNSSINYTNSKGFSLDFQYNQKNYTSWLVGGSFNFYKSYYVRDTLNLSLVNLYLGPKFYFSKDDLSIYCVINAGVTFFGGRNPEAFVNAFSFFLRLAQSTKLVNVLKLPLNQM